LKQRTRNRKQHTTSIKLALGQVYARHYNNPAFAAPLNLTMSAAQLFKPCRDVLMTIDTSNNQSTRNWMAATPQIERLTLSELTLPGTHNAGCDWQASYALIPGKHWLACQHQSFRSQLDNGSRALDVRLIHDPSAKSGTDRFRFHHNEYLSSRTLKDLLVDVWDFLSVNPDEFIVLDFKNFKGLKGAFDFKLFNALVVQALEPRMIPAANKRLTLAELKRISPLQRVLVCAPRHSELDANLFHDEVVSKWSGIATTNIAELRAFITTVISAPPSSWYNWTLSATCYSATGGPTDIHDELNAMFDPKNSDWARKCNIINVDFIEESKIVDFCRAANLLKAR
jgi:1-phosphatidylinositol phosphodiesterase